MQREDRNCSRKMAMRERDYTEIGHKLTTKGICKDEER